MRTALFVSMIFLLAFASACRQDENAATSPVTAGEQSVSTNLSPEELGELGAQIKKEPQKAEELLSARGLNQQSFEAAIREVTQDPEASKRYAAAYNKASA